VVIRRGGAFRGEEGVSPAQILVAVLIAALVALVLMVALRRVL
jgi:cytosine/uracil/thiamine/allantoin permease